MEVRQISYLDPHIQLDEEDNKVFSDLIAVSLSSDCRKNIEEKLVPANQEQFLKEEEKKEAFEVHRDEANIVQEFPELYKQ